MNQVNTKASTKFIQELQRSAQRQTTRIFRADMEYTKGVDLERGGRDFLKNIQAMSNTLNECVEPFAIIKAYFGKVVIIHGILREDKITFCKYWRGLVPCKPP